MNRKIRLVTVCILLTVQLMACSGHPPNDALSKNASVGVIETRGNREKSRIILYDTDLNEVGEVKLKYATVGSIFETPLVFSEWLYIIPQGYANKKDAKTVLEVSLDDFSVKNYSIKQVAMESVAVNQDYIYTCNNLNLVSYINKYDRETKETESVEIPGVIISKLLYVDKELYAFGTMRSDSSLPETPVFLSYLYIYDDALNLQETIDVSQCGSNQYKAIAHEGCIYFTSYVDTHDRPTKIMGKFNIADKSIEPIELSQVNPLDVIIYNNKMIVSHFDLVASDGGGLSVFDLNTKQSDYIELNHGAQQMSVCDEQLYILSDWKIYVYDINTMKLLKATDISHMDKEFSYLSGIFTIKKKANE